MPSRTNFTEQEVYNDIYGSSPLTKYTLQEVANLEDNDSTHPTHRTFQYILNTNLGLHGTALSEQVALFRTLQNEIALEGPETRYTVQEMLNMAFILDVSLPDAIGETNTGLPGYPAPGGNSSQHEGLLFLMGAA